MPKKISKETPLAEITLRRYEHPCGLSQRELVRKVCLSLGLLQPGDSRDIIVDIFSVLIDASRKKKLLSCVEIENNVISLRKKANLPMLGIASSNIRRQLRRLKDLFIIKKTANKYCISEFEPLSSIFEEKIRKFYLDSIVLRVREYCEEIDKA